MHALQPCAPPPARSAPPRARRGRARHARCALSFGNDERNDAGPPPLVQPSPSLSPRGAVETQLTELARNDTPRRDHGLEVTYLFAHGTGGFGMSRYFGFSADLYHFGHFALKFRTHRRQLLDHAGFEVLRESAEGSGGAVSGRVDVDVAVQPRGGGAPRRWRFAQLRAEGLGRTAGCWLTDSVMPLDDKDE
jgi:hypothetical protein